MTIALCSGASCPMIFDICCGIAYAGMGIAGEA